MYLCMYVCMHVHRHICNYRYVYSCNQFAREKHSFRASLHSIGNNNANNAIYLKEKQTTPLSWVCLIIRWPVSRNGLSSFFHNSMVINWNTPLVWRNRHDTSGYVMYIVMLCIPWYPRSIGSIAVLLFQSPCLLGSCLAALPSTESPAKVASQRDRDPGDPGATALIQR